MSPIQESILLSVKQVCGVEEDNTDFDVDIIMHINSSFAELAQLGAGPIVGFMIEDAVPVWTDFLGASPLLNMVKSFVCLNVRMMFDPPGSGFHVTAMEKQIEQMKWRINAHHEANLVVPVVVVIP